MAQGLCHRKIGVVELDVFSYQADADGAGYFVAANDVAGAIILMDGTIAGAAFYGISAAARERAFTAVRMSTLVSPR